MSNAYYNRVFNVMPGGSIGSRATEDEFLRIQQGFDAVASAVVVAAPAWVGGTTYAAGYTVYSPIDYQEYRRKSAGGGTDDPSIDPTNWEFRKATLASEVPQTLQSADYTLVLSDAGKHILHPSADTTVRVFTIPSNASVQFRIGTAVTFINQHGGGVITISINSDTLRLSPVGTTANKTLVANGIATAVKVADTEWIISGPGLT